MDVRPQQIWQTRPNTNAPWRRVKVVNVNLDAVELQYLDTPGKPDIATTIATTQSAMLASDALFKLVSDKADYRDDP
jgi:hypothetical protein